MWTVLRKRTCSVRKSRIDINRRLVAHSLPAAAAAVTPFLLASPGRATTATMGCCRGFNARLLFLMGCAMIEYVAHTVVLVLAPMIATHFYPQTPFPRLGFYTALLAGAGYLGHALSCRLWINVARSLQSSKGVVLWGLAITGAGFFSLLLCQSLLAMTLVRFATGLFSGVLPVALIEIDTICGYGITGVCG